MPFTPALSLHLGRFLHCVISYFLLFWCFFFRYPFQRAGLTGKAKRKFNSSHRAQIMSQGKRHPQAQPGGPTTWPTGFWASAGVTPPEQPTRPSITISRGRTPPAGSPGWNLHLYQREGPRYKFAESILPGREHSASFGFHNTPKGRVQHLRQTDIWKRSNKDRETTLTPQKHVPEAAFLKKKQKQKHKKEDLQKRHAKYDACAVSIFFHGSFYFLTRIPRARG